MGQAPLLLTTIIHGKAMWNSDVRGNSNFVELGQEQARKKGENIYCIKEI